MTHFLNFGPPLISGTGKDKTLLVWCVGEPWQDWPSKDKLALKGACAGSRDLFFLNLGSLHIYRTGPRYTLQIWYVGRSWQVY